MLLHHDGWHLHFFVFGIDGVAGIDRSIVVIVVVAYVGWSSSLPATDTATECQKSGKAGTDQKANDGRQEHLGEGIVDEFLWIFGIVLRSAPHESQLPSTLT